MIIDQLQMNNYNIYRRAKEKRMKKEAPRNRWGQYLKTLRKNRPQARPVRAGPGAPLSGGEATSSQ